MKNIIPQERVLKLSDPDVTKREYDTIVREIGDRVKYIWSKLLDISGRKWSWYAFQNDNYNNDGDGSTGGCFDPLTNSEFIQLDGNHRCRDIDGDFAEGFPTRFLWTENEVWEQEVLNHIVQNQKVVEQAKRDKELAKQAKKQQLEADKAARKKIIASIRSKLTSEEMSYISFK